MQGVLLACSAIEKYLKAATIVVNGDFQKVHIRDVRKLKQLFRGRAEEEIFNYFDDTFFKALRSAYEFRYIDQVKAPKSFGFIINQFLGELDYTVDKLESLFIVEHASGGYWISNYKRAIADNDPDLYLNNYLLNKEDKNQFMERASQVFGRHYDPAKMVVVNIELTEKISFKYEGHIMAIDAQFE